MRPGSVFTITSGWRVYVFGRRLHHGRFGEFVVLAGALLIAHDWKDRPWPFRDKETGDGESTHERRR